MIALIIFMFTPIIIPLLALYFSTWNAKDPKYQEFVAKYGKDALRHPERYF